MPPFTMTLLFEAAILMAVTGSILQGITIERSKLNSFGSSDEGKPIINRKLTLQSLSQLASLGPGSNLKFANDRIFKSAKGVKRVRLIQTYAGYDVFGSSVEAEMDNTKYFSGQMHGEIVKNIHKYIPDPETCQWTAESLLNKAFELEQIIVPNEVIVEKKNATRMIFAGPGMHKPTITYKVEFFYRKGSVPSHPVYFIDACSGNVLFSYDHIMSTFGRTATSSSNLSQDFLFLGSQTMNVSSADTKANQAACSISCEGEGGNNKIGKVDYNYTPYCLNVRKLLNLCTFTGKYTKLIDNDGSTSRTRTRVVSSSCRQGYRDAINGAYGVANDAFFHGELFGNFYESEYDITILDYRPRVVVHYDVNLENAYCDGTDTFYGDGDRYFHPLVSLDIVAHELAHAITARNSRLVYRGMSGGINEAFSDITGATVRSWFMGGDVDWRIGAEVFKLGDALRYMDDPPRDGTSIQSIFGYRPFMEVHSSSGIYNHAFYSMVSRQNVNIFDAYKSFLDANLNLWGPFTNFFSGACNVVQAAYDNGFNHRRIRRGFRRVGIPVIFCNYAALTTSMFVGETREDILVRATRSPIIKIDLEYTQTNSTRVKAVADDNPEIQVVICIDNEAIKVIAKGSNSVKFNNVYSSVYVKLVADVREDIHVKMAVLDGDAST